MTATGDTPRQVAILLYPGFQTIDVTGPLEVFHGADRLVRETPRRGRGYEVTTVASRPGPIESSSGLRVVPDTRIEGPAAPYDTLIVPGGSGRGEAQRDAALMRWMGEASRSARRTASVCTGAFLLARAGVLDGLRATTHWAFAGELQRRHPSVRVDPEPIFVREGGIWTSAGVSAGMDLALAMVEEDLDREIALTIARHLVLFLRRPGGQRQFSAALAAQEPSREPLREVRRLVLEDPAGDHRVEAMAERAHMSARHFARAFTAETGTTPARFVESVRIEAARRWLEETAQPLAAVAAGCGFGTAETLRRTFLRSLGVGPAEYRRRFRTGREESWPQAA